MKFIFTVLFCAVIGLHLYAQTNPAPVRLAIVSESTNTTAAADLLTAEFSKNDKVQLLERAEIEKIIREQQLSLNNLDRLKLGQLLGADGLLALQPVTEGTNLILSAQLVAVRPGVLVADELFGRPAQDASEWSAKVVSRLEPLLPKLNVLPADAIPISVVNFHAGVRTAAAAELEQQIFFLTVERLVREKRLFVLERRRMQALSGEKEISSAETEPFWNGKYLLDGAIDRDGFNPDVVTISARLIPPGGNPVLIEAKGSRTNYTEVVNHLAEKVFQALKLEANPEAWNTADEADKFFKEAQWNLTWGIFPQARQSAEAAWALGKHDADCMKLRVQTFMPPPDSGVVYFPPREKPNPQKIDDAIQAARLYQEFSQNLPTDEPKLGSDWYQLGLDNLTIATRVLEQFNWSPEFYMPEADKLADLRAQSREMAKLLSRAPSVHDSYFVGSRKVTYDDLDHFAEHSSIYSLEIEGGCLWQEKPEDTLALYRELMATPAFRYLHSQLWFRGPQSVTMDNIILPQFPDRLVGWNEIDRTRIPGLWNKFLNELLNSPDVFWQMEARAMRLADTVHLSKKLDMAGSHEAYKAAYKAYSNELTSAFTDFFDALVTNRIYFKTNNVDVLYLNWGIDDLLRNMGGDIGTDTKDFLNNQYRTEYVRKLAAKDAEAAQIVAARDKDLAQAAATAKNLDAFAKQIKFLQDNEPYNPQSFVEMFIFGYKDYSKEQAQEIKPLLAEYKKQISGRWARIGQGRVEQIESNIEHILNPETVVSTPPNHVIFTNSNFGGPLGGNFPPDGPLRPGHGMPPFAHVPPHFPAPGGNPKPAAETPGPEPLVSSNIVTIKSFYPLPMHGLPGDKPHAFRFTDHQLVEGKLLLDFRYEAWVNSFDQNGNWQSAAEKTYSGVALFDPVSSRWQVAALPDFITIESMTSYAHQSTIWRGGLYSSSDGKVLKLDEQKNAWITNALSISGQLYNLGGKLYVTDYNSIQEVTENMHGTKLLASIQRQPPVTSLDSQGGLMNLVLFLDVQNSLCAAVHDKIFRWNGVDWREIGTARSSFQPSVYEGGLLFMTDGWNARPVRISRFDIGSTNVELCLGLQDRGGPNGPLPNSNQGVKPLWKVPAGLSLPNLSAALCQSNLFFMTDHSEKQDIVKEESGTGPDGAMETSQILTGEKFLAKDGYNSALFCFLRGQPAAEKVRLNFDDPEGCPPTAGLGSNLQPLIPQVGFTKSWMLFTQKLLLCGREDSGNIGSSEPPGFIPGIWVAPLDSILTEVTSLKQTPSDPNHQ